MDDKKYIQKLKPIKKLDESGADNDRLILYVISILESKKIEPTFDKIVVVAHKLFPSRFSLLGFKEYPDGKRVHDCLFHCTYKTKKWLDGGAKQGYKLNEKGKFMLKTLMNEYENSKFKRSGKISGGAAKRKERAIIDKAMKTKAYSYFIQGKLFELNSDYLIEALRCVPGASKKEMKDNYKIIYQYALEIDANKTFIDFLKKLKQILDL